MAQNKQALQDGLRTAFFDWAASSNLAYRPTFVSNDAAQGRCVLSSIEEELARCDEFLISVAFITRGGITPLLQTLKELERRNVRGRILTTDYLGFSEPAALEKLHGLRNIELRMFCTGGEAPGFHTKGYIFRRDGLYRLIVGSSNMTMNALKVNREWNMRLVGYGSGETVRDILAEFETLWSAGNTKRYEDFIADYRVRYELSREQRRRALQQDPVELDQVRLEPNAMQVAFVRNLRELVRAGKDRALLISATGTGKTYASAFAMRDMHPDRMLFLVHREQIAKQALRSYRRVFGRQKEDGTPYRYELLSGSTARDLDAVKDADFLFATMQTMSKEDVLHAFDPRAFSEICIDEAHHSGAASYRRIMAYFHPRFWLGMTASPDTSRFNVYELYDHNIAYEIRLQQALEENLLCPFHYFGITDLTVGGEVIGDEEHGDRLRSFGRLVADERVDHILEESAYYGCSGSRVKGLIFCSRRKEAEALSAKFNARGYRTAALTGEDDEAVREAVLERLAMEVPAEETGPAPPGFDPKKDRGYLDYVFAVDVLSEGVDVPEINQVILLRPTQSAVVFVQQLGRGLRKSPGKEYVVILDFIGNYRSNFLIPIALSGDRTYNKDNVRRYVMEGDRVIPGASTIHFDAVSRKRIFESIDAANFSDLALIRENYRQLKNKLGRIPALADFDAYGSMDVCRIFDSPSLGSYYRFLEKYEPAYKVRLTAAQARVVEFLSRKLAPGKRVQELELLRLLPDTAGDVMAALRQSLASRYGIRMPDVQAENVVRVMTNEFPTAVARKTWRDCVFLQRTADGWGIAPGYAAMLRDAAFRGIVLELISFGIDRYEKTYRDRYGDTDFVLYQKYTYEDACRLLNWENNIVPLNIGGYRYDERTKTFPVFINYDKSDDISDTTKYEDRFTGEDRLIAISKSNRTAASSDVQNFLHAQERGIAVHLFVRKNKNDRISKEYYYLGRMTATGRCREFRMPNTEVSAVEIEWKLDVPVREDIYRYIIG